MAAASFDGSVRQSSAPGTRVGPLGVHAASRKIGKPAACQQQRKPVIIYMVSPKIIHVEAHEFMSLVQRLTGPGAAAAAAAGGGEDKKRASSPASSSSPGATGPRAPPVRVKARALNRPAGPSVSVSVTTTRPQQQLALPSAAAGPSPSPSGFLFQDLSPLRGAALKGEAPLVSPGWLHHVGVGDHFFSTGAAALGSPSAFLDIFGSLPSQQQ